MKNSISGLSLLKTVATALLAALLPFSCTSQTPLYKDASQPSSVRADDLIARMNVDEKIGQLLCPLGWPMYEKVTPNSVRISDSYRHFIQEQHGGMLWATFRADPWTRKTLETGLNPQLSSRAYNALQHYAMDSTRLGIPILLAEEAPHGHMAIGTTVFPTSIGLSASWDTELLEEVGQVIGAELTAQGATIGVAWTEDFKIFHQKENAFLPYNRNGVLFPRKISGRYAMLSRPSDTGHTAFGDIFYSESPDMEFWGHHRHVMAPAPFEVSAWQCMKIGAGPVPIETSEGWLLLYHGVLRSCNGYVYAFGSALLDLEQPWKVLARSGQYLISPREIYELTGDVPNVTFPCAALHDPATGRIAVYYGCADTVTGMAFGYIPEIIDFTKKTSIV